LFIFFVGIWTCRRLTAYPILIAPLTPKLEKFFLYRQRFFYLLTTKRTSSEAAKEKAPVSLGPEDFPALLKAAGILKTRGVYAPQGVLRQSESSLTSKSLFGSFCGAQLRDNGKYHEDTPSKIY